jgi:hypothetical protein
LDPETAKKKLHTLGNREGLDLNLDFIRRPWLTFTSPNVYMPREFLEKSENWIQGWMLHEIEHRKRSPGSIETLLLWVYRAIERGVREPGKLAHFYTDLVIDQNLSSSRKEEISSFLAERSPTLNYLDDANQELYRQVLELIEGSNRNASDKIAKTYEIIFENAKDDENRISDLAAFLKEDFQGGSPFVLDIPTGLELSFEERDKTIRQLLYSSVTPAQIEDFLDRLRLGLTEDQRRQLLSSAKRLHLYT